MRATYQRHTPTCRMVTSKTKVAPVKSLSMPRLELCGAALLSKVLTTVRQALNIPIQDVHAWSDSSIVLAWLDGLPKRYKTYVGNRIASITNLIPPIAWKHVQHKISRIVLREVFHPLNSGITTCGGLVPPGCCQTQSKYLNNRMKQNLVH